MISDEFTRYELRTYAMSIKLAAQLKEEKEAAIQSLYDDCSPSTRFYDASTDRWLKTGVNTEDKAIEIIETREMFDKKIKRYMEKIEAFNEALNTLSEAEQNIIKAYYFKNIPSDEASLYGAEDKMCKYIGDMNYKKHVAEKEARKEMLRKSVIEYKSRCS
ncbi:hypothetical protein AAEO50_12270 [Rossellomorea oryzaecorticis]|uniref:Uncharacterized protein n=1 Tax=Rossellomorea oryzaecorticis TaxID=1396505 RepID=A0ABU9KAM8_9BACI